MSREQGTGKYEQLLERCRGLAPIPTAVAHPCESSGARRGARGRRQGRDHADSRRPDGQDRGSGEAERRLPRRYAHRRCAAQPGRGRQGGGARAQGRGGAADERQPAHRRAAERRRRARDGTADGPPHQPRVHHGRADVPQGADRHRRRHQHRADARREGRHLPERDRPRDQPRRREAEGGDSRRRRNRHLQDAGDDRRGGAVQDGRPGADHGRTPRRAAGVRQRHQPRGGAQ